jgi:hypothetical protein
MSRDAETLEVFLRNDLCFQAIIHTHTIETLILLQAWDNYFFFTLF